MPSPNEDLTSYTPVYYSFYNHVTGATTGPISQGLGISLRRKRTTVSAVTPGYNNIRKKHLLLPLNGYAKSVDIISDPSTTWKADIRQADALRTYTYVGTCVSNGCSTEGVASADDPVPLVISKLLEAATQFKANSAVTLAEAGKTADMVAKTATRFVSAIRALRKGHLGDFTTALGVTVSIPQIRRFGKRKRFAFADEPTDRKTGKVWRRDTREARISDFVAQSWLEYSYGWKPLLQDIYDHTKAVAEVMVVRQNVVREVKARAETKRDSVYAYRNPNDVWDRDRRHVDRRWARGILSFKLPPQGAQPWETFGISNPATVAWELVPFSFVVDWFLPVGNYLQSLTATNGLQFVSCVMTTRDFMQLTSSFKSNGLTVGSIPPATYKGIGSGQLTRERLEIRRYLYTGFPSPPNISFKDPRSFAHAASAIALLQTVFLHK